MADDSPNCEAKNWYSLFRAVTFQRLPDYISINVRNWNSYNRLCFGTWTQCGFFYEVFLFHWILVEKFTGCKVVATLLFMVASADMIREADSLFRINVSRKTPFAMADRTRMSGSYAFVGF